MRMPREYKIIDFPPLTDEQKERLQRLAEMPDSEIDCSDIPEHTEEDFKNGHFYYAQSLKLPKKDIHTKIDIDTIEWLQSPGKQGYQTRLNAVLRWARLNGCPLSFL